MLEREILVAELWKRLDNVDGVNRTARNPSSPPNLDDFPVIQFFELDDNVIKIDSRGGYPIYTRKIPIIIEPYINATEEGLSTKELGEFVQKIKKKIYEGGNNLNKKCSYIIEKDGSKILRPPVGENSIGISLHFEVLYTENISRLF